MHISFAATKKIFYKLNLIKIAAPRKKEAKKLFGPDPQNTLQPYRPGCNSIFQVLQKARTKKIIIKTV